VKSSLSLSRKCIDSQKGQRRFFFPVRPALGPPILQSNGRRGFRVYSGPGVKLTAQLHLVARFRNR
jgi:hypothetical protein